MPNSSLLMLNRSSASCTFCWINPSPPTKYGRTPAPCVPPIRTPRITLPMNEVTLLSSMRSTLLSSPSKNSGLCAKSASQPRIPAPIHPIEAPHVRCSRPDALPPKPAPTLGVKSQSAFAVDGASISASADTISHFFIRFSSSGRRRVQATYPVELSRDTRAQSRQIDEDESCGVCGGNQPYGPVCAVQLCQSVPLRHAKVPHRPAREERSICAQEAN